MVAPRPWWQLAAPGMVVGTVAAVVRLDKRALWLDEAYTLGAVHQIRSAVPRTSGTMSLYYVVLRAWFLVSESVWWMRFLSVVVAVAAIAVVVALTRRIFDDRAAVAAGVLVALSPMWWTYAREARAYAFVLALVALTWLAVDHGIDPDEPHPRRWWWAHTAAAVALPLCHGLTVLQLVPQLVVVVVAGADRTTVLRAARGVGMASAITAVLARTASEEVGNWVEPLGWDQVWFTFERFLQREEVLTWGLLAVLAAGTVVGLVAVVRADDRRERARALVPFLWGVAPMLLLAALSVVRPSYVPRYVVGSVPGLALLMWLAIARLAAWKRIGGAVLALAVGATLTYGLVDLQTRPLDGWRLATQRLAADVRPGDTILLAREETTRPPFEAAWRDVDPATPPRLLPSDRPLGEVLRFEPDETDIATRWDEARGAGRLWVVGDEQRMELDRLPSLVESTPDRPASHREVGRWSDRYGNVTVVLLEPV